MLTKWCRSPVDPSLRGLKTSALVSKRIIDVNLYLFQSRVLFPGYGILKIITYVAVVSNVIDYRFQKLPEIILFTVSQAFVIAYTSDFIPRMVYKYVYSETHDLKGYIYHSLSIFNVS